MADSLNHRIGHIMWLENGILFMIDSNRLQMAPLKVEAAYSVESEQIDLHPHNGNPVQVLNYCWNPTYDDILDFRNRIRRLCFHRKLPSLEGLDSDLHINKRCTRVL